LYTYRSPNLRPPTTALGDHQLSAASSSFPLVASLDSTS